LILINIYIEMHGQQNIKEKKSIGNLGVYWRMILEGILRKKDGKAWAFGCGEGGVKANTVMKLHIS